MITFKQLQEHSRLAKLGIKQYELDHVLETIERELIYAAQAQLMTYTYTDEGAWDGYEFVPRPPDFLTEVAIKLCSLDFNAQVNKDAQTITICLE